MGKKLPHTPNSRIKSALRQVFLRSRERAAVLKEAGYTCGCGKKQSRAKGKEVYIEVHHKKGIDNWQEIYNCIRENLLNKEDMIVLCKDCHDDEHAKEEV